MTHNTNMPPLVVLDTNVLVAGLRSRRGASHRVLGLVAEGRIAICLAVPLVLEYEAVLKREAELLGMSEPAVDAVVDYLCSVATLTEVHYRWRPILRDPGDDHLLELAVAAGGAAIVTFNRRDFAGSERFGVRVLTPQELWQETGVQL
jgi:putative PIN family toxin of toxin-antitoxin system